MTLGKQRHTEKPNGDSQPMAVYRRNSAVTDGDRISHKGDSSTYFAGTGKVAFEPSHLWPAHERHSVNKQSATKQTTTTKPP